MGSLVRVQYRPPPEKLEKSGFSFFLPFPRVHVRRGTFFNVNNSHLRASQPILGGFVACSGGLYRPKFWLACSVVLVGSVAIFDVNKVLETVFFCPLVPLREGKRRFLDQRASRGNRGFLARLWGNSSCYFSDPVLVPPCSPCYTSDTPCGRE